MGNATGFVVDSARLYCPYDGPLPFEHDFQINTTGHLGQDGRVANSVIGRPGKFGKAFQSGAAASNFVKNPIFENNITDDWTFFEGGASGSAFQATDRYYVGNNSIMLQSGTSAVGVRSSTNISLSSNNVASVQARVLRLNLEFFSPTVNQQQTTGPWHPQ